MRWGPSPSPPSGRGTTRTPSCTPSASGAGALDPTGFELDFTTENSDGVTQRVLPTFTTIVGQGGGAGPRSATSTRPCWSTASSPSGCTARSRRRGRCRPRRRSPACTTRARPAWSCSRASRATPASGELAFTSRTALFIRGAGGFGGPRNPEGDEESALAAEPLPTREPDEVVSYATRPDQALLYRLSGRPQPAALGPDLRQAGRLRPPDPARAVHLRLHRARPAPHRVRLGPGALRRHAGPLLQADACPATR